MRTTASYDAFLSYGHAADRALAQALQSELQRYAKPWQRTRSMRVFRDDGDLAAEPVLWEAIERALDASTWFVLLASPAAASSPWVDREVDWWLSHRSADHLLVVLTGGELADALPPSLRSAELPEPRWVDLRGAGHGGSVDRLDVRLQEAVVDIAATVRHIPKGELVGEHLRQRRRTVRWAGGAIVGLSLFLVAALVATVAFAVTNSRLSAALDTANARSLGQAASAQLPTDPGIATQLALAADRADPGQIDARNALGAVFLARRSTTATRAVPDSAPVSGLGADAAADVAILDTSSGPVIADGLEGSAPTFAGIPGAGPATSSAVVGGGGRWVLSAEPDGPLRLWDRSTGSTRALPERGTAIVSPTPDRAHLIIGTPTAAGTRLQTVDLLSGSSVALTTLPETAVAGIWQTSDPARIMVRAGGGAPGSGQLTVRDARSGAILSASPPDTRVAGDGSLTTRCVPDDVGGMLVVSEAASGKQLRRVENHGEDVPCVGYPALTADGRHVAWTNARSSSTSSVDVVEIVDLMTGRRTSAWVPAAVGMDPTQPQSPRRGEVARTGIVAPSVLPSISVHGNHAVVVDRGRIDTLSLSSAPTWRNTKSQRGGFPFTVGDGSVAVLSYADGGADAIRTSDGAEVGTLATTGMGLLPGERVVDRGGDPDEQTYVVTTMSPQGMRVRDFAVPSFRPLGVFDLVANGAAGFPRPDDQFGIEESAAGTFVILAAGTLSWWSAETHRLLAPPVRLANDASAAASLSDANISGVALNDSGDLLAVREPAGTGPDGTSVPAGVLLLHRGSDQRTRVTADVVTTGQGVQIVGSQLITLERPGKLVRRDVSSGEVLAPPVPVSPASDTRGILGVDATGLLVTDEGATSAGIADFWDMDAGRPVGQLSLPSSLGPGRLLDDRLEIDVLLDDFVSVPVDPQRWRDHLCGVQNRPFDDAERVLLPTGADGGPPCAR